MGQFFFQFFVFWCCIIVLFFVFSKFLFISDHIKEYLLMLKSYSFWYVIIFGMNIINILITVLFDDKLRDFTNKLTNAAKHLEKTSIVQEILEPSHLMKWLIIFFVFSTILTLLARLKTILQYTFLIRIKKNISDRLFGKILYYTDSYFSKNTNTVILTGIKNVVDGTDDVSFDIKKLLNEITFLAGCLYCFNKIDVFFVKTTLLWLFLWFFLVKFLSQFLYQLNSEVCQSKYGLNLHFGDVFKNIMNIKIFNTIDKEIAINKNHSFDVQNREGSCNMCFLMYAFASGLLFMIFLLIDLRFFYFIFINDPTKIGDLVFLLDKLKKINKSVDSIADCLMDISKDIGKIEKGMEVVNQDIEKSDLQTDNISVKTADISIKDLKYKAGNFILNIEGEIKIKEGSTVAIVGPSGGGKTTFFKLLLGLLKCEKGEIIIGGKNIVNYSSESLKNVFAFIPQEVELFHRSIIENLTYGSSNITKKQVEAIASKIKLHEMIESLEDGYESIIGENHCFSGGQKQRLIIARGLLRKSKIFLFDESTSSLDVKTEKEMLSIIEELTQGCTKFVIAHRLYTVRKADLILVLDNGMIVERGTHETLMEKKGIYHSLIETM